MRKALPALLLILAAFPLGCDDPSDVGIGLVEAQAGDTVVKTLPATRFASDGPADITGGDALSGAERVLTGHVDDPIAGSTDVIGYFDIVPAGSFSNAHQNGTVTYIQAFLEFEYRYGVTGEPLTLELSAVNEAWSPTDQRADTMLAVSDPIMQIEVDPSADEARFELPAAWIGEHEALFRDNDFVDSFHGFQIRPVSGSAVVGFTTVDSGLRVSAVPGDTLLFPVSKYITSTTSEGGNIPEGYLLLRDGDRTSLTLDFGFDEGELPSTAMHRALIRLNSDESLVLYPEGFEHTPLTGVRLDLVDEDGEAVATIAAVPAEDGTITFDSDTVAQLIQQKTQGKSLFSQMRVYVPATSGTIDHLLIKSGAPEAGGPRAFLTYTALN